MHHCSVAACQKRWGREAWAPGQPGQPSLEDGPDGVQSWVSGGAYEGVRNVWKLYCCADKLGQSVTKLFLLKATIDVFHAE